MLNLKKGLALVLAAATVFTFAPIANLGVTAKAAGNKDFTKESAVTVSVGGSALFDVPKMANEGTQYKVEFDSDYIKLDSLNVANSTVTSGVASGTWMDQTYSFRITGIKVTASTDVKVTYNTNGGQQTYTVPVTVTAPGDSTNGIVKNKTGFIGDGTKGNPYVVEVNPSNTDANFSFKLTPDTGYYTNKALTKVSSADASVIKVVPYAQSDLPDHTTTEASGVDNNKITLQYLKSGETTIKIEWTRYNVATQKRESASKDIYFKVVAKKSTLSVSGTEVGEGKLSATAPIVKTITLSADAPEAELGGKLDDPQRSDEKLVYSGAARNVTGETNNISTDLTKYTSSDLKIKDGKVSATAQALSGVEKYYDILVYNNLGNTDLDTDKYTGSTDAKLKLAVIRVIARRDGTNFTKVTATVGTDKEVAAQASYASNGTVKNASEVKNVQLSTADLQSVAFAYTTTNPTKTTVTSNDTSVVEVSGGKLVAKKVGNAVVTIKAESDTTHYGDAEIQVRVNVTDKYINNKIVAEDVYLNKLTRSAKIKATVTPAADLSYRIVNQLADGSYVTGTDSNITLAADGTVTYNTTAEGKAIVEITGASTNTAKAPTPAYITVYYSNEKLASRLNVETKSLNLNVGETGTVVASGSALSYASNDTDVATVDAKTGVVTAVKAGVATITVTDAGDANYQPGSKDVTVYVYGASDNTVAKPAKVTGVKVTNLKGGKVKVTWTKQNQKNIKYYVKKTVGKKSAGKSVGSNKTTLSVKKGATVKVKVKAYIYDTTGKKLVGSYSKTITKKTDKK